MLGLLKLPFELLGTILRFVLASFVAATTSCLLGLNVSHRLLQLVTRTEKEVPRKDGKSTAEDDLIYQEVFSPSHSSSSGFSDSPPSSPELDDIPPSSSSSFFALPVIALPLDEPYFHTAFDNSVFVKKPVLLGRKNGLGLSLDSKQDDNRVTSPPSTPLALLHTSSTETSEPPISTLLPSPFFKFLEPDLSLPESTSSFASSLETANVLLSAQPEVPALPLSLLTNITLLDAPPTRRISPIGRESSFFKPSVVVVATEPQAVEEESDHVASFGFEGFSPQESLPSTFFEFDACPSPGRRSTFVSLPEDEPEEDLPPISPTRSSFEPPPTPRLRSNSFERISLPTSNIFTPSDHTTEFLLFNPKSTTSNPEHLLSALDLSPSFSQAASASQPSGTLPSPLLSALNLASNFDRYLQPPSQPPPAQAFPRSDADGFWMGLDAVSVLWINRRFWRGARSFMSFTHGRLVGTKMLFCEEKQKKSRKGRGKGERTRSPLSQELME